MAKVNHKLINEMLRRKRARLEQERRRAEAAQLAAIEERCLKRALDSALERACNRWSPGLPDGRYVRPHPSDAGLKPFPSPAGRVADSGHKSGWCLPGSFENGKR